MPTPADDPEILHEWTRLEEELRKGGLPRTKVWKEIGDIYEVSSSAVRYWVDENYRKVKLELDRHRSRPGRYHREPYRRKYDKDYKRFTRNLPDFIKDVLEPGDVLKREELAKKLGKAAKRDPSVQREIVMKPDTLKSKIEEMNEDLFKEKGDKSLLYRGKDE